MNTFQSYNYTNTEENWNGRYGLRDCVAVKGILPCVGCVGIVETKLDRSSRGVHSSLVELTRLTILHFHCLRRTRIGLINLVKRGTSQKIKRGWLIFYAHLRENWKGWYVPRDCVPVKGALPCVGCLGILEAKLDRSCTGVHSYVFELTSLAILHFHCLSSLINPILDWLGWTLMCFWLCVGLLFPYSLWKSCPTQGWELCWDIHEQNWPMVGWNVAAT